MGTRRKVPLQWPLLMKSSFTEVAEKHNFDEHFLINSYILEQGHTPKMWAVQYAGGMPLSHLGILTKLLPQKRCWNVHYSALLQQLNKWYSKKQWLYCTVQWIVCKSHHSIFLNDTIANCVMLNKNSTQWINGGLSKMQPCQFSADYGFFGVTTKMYRGI